MPDFSNWIKKNALFLGFVLCATDLLHRLDLFHFRCRRRGPRFGQRMEHIESDCGNMPDFSNWIQKNALFLGFVLCATDLLHRLDLFHFRCRRRGPRFGQSMERIESDCGNMPDFSNWTQKNALFLGFVLCATDLLHRLGLFHFRCRRRGPRFGQSMECIESDCGNMPDFSNWTQKNALLLGFVLWATDLLHRLDLFHFRSPRFGQSIQYIESDCAWFQQLDPKKCFVSRLYATDLLHRLD